MKFIPDQTGLASLNSNQTSSMRGSSTSSSSSGSGGFWSGVVDVLGKIWNLPNTILGLVYGGVGHIAGMIMGTNPSISIGNNAIQFKNNPLMPTAMTLGNTIIYGTGSSYQPNARWLGHSGTLGQEEMQHTLQGQALGIFYLPAHAIFGIAATTSSGSVGINQWHGGKNILEVGPHDQNNPRPWK